jgi:hypothetical protein
MNVMIYLVNIKDNLDEKGNILTESLCTQLGDKQNSVYNQIKSFTKRAGRRNKHKISRRKNKRVKKALKDIENIQVINR